MQETELVQIMTASGPAGVGVVVLALLLKQWLGQVRGDLVALRKFGGTQDVRSLCRIFGATLLLSWGTVALPACWKITPPIYLIPLGADI